jgi:hypothetical protein
MLVDGEPAMQWIADRFNGLPTTPNCGQFLAMMPGIAGTPRGRRAV